ncbi:MAG TPA: Hsp20/alpha crystallin family protein [Streptosporangiaceae bacterium]|nr:Hsp20/alpha crystallin family protein [Streptosporangiaceae bacterium]
MNAVTRRESRGFLPDLFDWVDQPFSLFRPFTTQPIRMEDFVEDGHYVVRAELPGIDPDKQVEVTVEGGMLTIRAERQEERAGKYHSEFRYGTFTRHLTLPAAADETDVKATYDKGVLEVRIGLKEEKARAARQIPITPAA